MADESIRDWTIVLLLTALALALAVLSQTLSRYATAYMEAPSEVTTFIDTVDFSIQENESHDRDIQRVPALEDKIRLGRLLREIQKCGDDLREDLNGMLEGDGGSGSTTTLRIGARILWAAKRKELEDRVRRLDMLRMRFLVVYMGIVSGGASASEGAGGHSNKSANSTPQKDLVESEKSPFPVTPHQQPALPKGLGEAIAKKPLRRLTTPAIGHKNDTARDHKKGWFGVVAELQRSPKMLQRHATIEDAMSKTPSPSTSP